MGANFTEGKEREMMGTTLVEKNQVGSVDQGLGVLILSAGLTGGGCLCGYVSEDMFSMFWP